MSEGKSITLAIGGECCRVVFPNNDAAARALARELSAFVTDAEPTLTFTITFDRGLQKPATAGWKAITMERREDGILAYGPSHWIRIPSDLNRVDARIVQEFQLATVLRIGLCTILPLKGKGFLVHAAAVANGDGAYLFPGRSDSGKSTLVANSPGKRCLTEETAVVRVDNGRYWVFGFPLWANLEALSMTGEATQLVGMFLLKKGAPRVNPVSRAKALGYLLPNVYFPLRDLGARSRVLETCSRFVEEIQVAELVFSMNPEFWRCIERG